MGKFKGSKGSRSNDDQGGEDALNRVLANGYTSETDRGLPGRQARRKAGPAGRFIIDIFMPCGWSNDNTTTLYFWAKCLATW